MSSQASGLKLNLWRQLDILPSDALEGVKINMIGCGGIGSSTILELARLGITDFEIWDPDKVEWHNLTTQKFRFKDIGRFKVEAIVDILSEFTTAQTTVHKSRFKMDSSITGILISGVDSMAARKDIWKQIRLQPSLQVYIDGRMGGEQGVVYTVNSCDPPNDVEWYEDTLVSDTQVPPLRCSAQGISYNLAFIASLIASQVKRFLRQSEYPRKMKFHIGTPVLVVEF